MLCQIFTSFFLKNQFGKQYSKARALLTLAICFLYAVSDEVHQVFVPGRAGRISDVMIDTSGAVLGILLVFSVIQLIKYRKNKTLSKSKKGVFTK